MDKKALAATNRRIVVWRSIGQVPVSRMIKGIPSTTLRANPRDRTIKQWTSSLMARTSLTQLAVTQSRTMTDMRFDPMRSAGDQAAGASRVVDSVQPQGLASTGASSGESVPTTSTTAGRSSESTVSVVQRPLTRAASTRASSAATKSRALLAQGSKQSSPHVPLLELPPRPRETPRPSPSRRKEHGFTIGRGRSPSIEPDYDEDDDAWMASIVEESKEFLSDIQRDQLEGSAVGRSIGLEC